MAPTNTTNIWDQHQSEIIDTLVNDRLVVMPTDTVYGVVARASSQNAVDQIYLYRKNVTGRPCIILIADIADLTLFDMYPTDAQMAVLHGVWPGPVTVIMDSLGDRHAYLHRGTFALAFRIPESDGLRMLIRQTGPLLAPSANCEGMPTAQTIEMAQEYFADAVGLYVDGGTIVGNPSRIIRLGADGGVTVVRE